MKSLAQVLNRFGDAYSQRYGWTPEQAKVAGCIRACRTPKLGGVEYRCEHCGSVHIRYCSCRNRHCPKCQQQATKQWRRQQQQALLPVAYFHLVFTLPHELNGWVRLHPDVIYRCMFQSVWQTLKAFGEDPKRLDGQLGVTAVLHTWGQQLDQHVHLHCIVPAGAWSKAEQSWHSATSNYLFPVTALSRCYRGKMVSALRAAWKNEALHRVSSAREVSQRLQRVMQTDWVVYTKACHDAKDVLDYLSRYTHKVALSESRIMATGQEHVQFRWKDYRDHRQKVMRLSGVEFLRRFFQHVLPKGFMRIRHYGFLSNRWRRESIREIRVALQIPLEPENKPAPPLTEQTWVCRDCKVKAVRRVVWLKPAVVQRE